MTTLPLLDSVMLRQLLDSMPDCVFVLNREERVLYVNPAGRRYLSCPQGDLAGRKQSEFFPPAVAERQSQSLQRVFSTGEPLSRENIRETPERTFWIEARLIPLKDAEGQTTAVLGQVRDITDRKQAQEELSKSREQLRALAAHLQSVREEERVRMAREIHDELGQSLTAVKMDVAWLERHLSPADSEASAKFKGLSTLLDDTIQTVRRISSELRPGVLDDLGLGAALEWLGQEHQNRTGVVCRLFTADCPPLDVARSTALFRICQEALTNVARHAQAKEVTLRLKKEGTDLVLEVADNGQGIIEPEIQGFHSLGLLGMRERAALLGGEMQLKAVAGLGTTITVRMPLGGK